MDENKEHIVGYGTYALVLVALIALTLLSVGITYIELGQYSVAGALIFAAVKSSLVLLIFMHLKFDRPMYRIMAGFVLAVFIAVLVITFLDYLYR